MKIILINGQPGSGKSTIANHLKNEILQSAFIDADSLVSTNQFKFNENQELMFSNAVALIDNFSAAGYTRIFISGIIRNQEHLDNFLAKIKTSAGIVFIWLRANKNLRLNRILARGRDAADKEEHFNTLDQMSPDTNGFLVKKGVYKEIDTSTRSVQDIVKEIKSYIM